VLRKIFGPKRDEVTQEWRRLHKEELQDPYSSPNIIRVIKSRRIRWTGNVGGTRDKRGAYRIWLEDNIKMDPQEIGWGGMDWIIRLRVGTGGWRL
jgi:hypothetical protein